MAMEEDFRALMQVPARFQAEVEDEVERLRPFAEAEDEVEPSRSHEGPRSASMRRRSAAGL